MRKAKIKKTKNIKAQLLAYAFIFIGMTGFLGGFFITFGAIEYEEELPLSEVKGIIADDVGNIYVGLGFYGRIQVYNKYGHYLRSWHVPTGGGNFVMNFTKNQEILVATARVNHLITYDLYGKNLHSEKYKDDGIYEKMQEECDNFIDTEGYHYFATGLFFTEIIKVKTSPLEQAYLIVSQGILMFIFKGPFPAIIFAMLGTMMHFFLGLGKDSGENDTYYQIKMSKNRK